MSTKRRALIAALQVGNEGAVFAMQPSSQHFRDELACVEPDDEFLAEAMQALCGSLGAGHKTVPCASMTWLVSRGAPIQPLLSAGSGAPRSPGRRAALEKFKLLAHVAEALADTAILNEPEIFSALRDSDDAIHHAAVEAVHALASAGARGTPALSEALLVRIRRSEPRTRALAAEALATLDAAAAARCLTDADEEVRALGMSALAFVGAEAAAHAPALVDILASEGCGASALRAEAARALGKLGLSQEQLRPLALALRADPDSDVREAAANALGQAGSEAVIYLDALEAAAETDDARAVQQAAQTAMSQVLGALG